MLVFNRRMDMNKTNNLSQPLGRHSVFQAEDAPETVVVRPFEYRHPFLTAVVICLPTALALAMMLSLPGQTPLA